MIRFRYGYILVVMIIIITVFTATVAAQTTEDAASEPVGQEAFIKDAEEYALAMNVSLEEAIQRLSFQDAIGDLQGKLSAEEDVFAGLYVQHTPNYQVIVLLTRIEENLLDNYITNIALSDIVTVRQVNVSLAELRAAQKLITQELQQIAIPIASGINIPANQVEVYVTDKDLLVESLHKTNIQLPDYITVIEVESLGTEETDIYAGLALSTCTSGFSVKNASGTKGVLTAAHCPNTQSYSGTNLPFKGAAYGGRYDVQWHQADHAFTVKNLAYYGSSNPRFIYSTKHRNNQYVNQWVCKYGVETGYTCGQISDTSYADTFNGTYFFNLIRVHRSGVNLSSGGDSGGPWMWSNTAFGVHKGAPAGDGNDAVYMAINYIDVLGLTVLTD